MIVYIQGYINVSAFRKAASEHNLDPRKLVFIFPGNSSHHGANNNLFSIKGGGGLAVPAGQLGQLGYPVLSLPTTSMEHWETDDEQKQIVKNAIADLYRAFGAGYSLLLPIRKHANSTYFDSSLAVEGNVEPSFWGANALRPNKPLAHYYIQELNRLDAFIASPTDESNPFWEAYNNGGCMREDDLWLQRPTQRTLTKIAPAQKNGAEVTEPPTSFNPEESNNSAYLDLLIYSALLTTGFASIAITLLAWPVIVPSLVTAGIISAPLASITTAGITVTGVIGAATSYLFFQRSSQASFEEDLSKTPKP